jgi:hypothetical protein
MGLFSRPAPTTKRPYSARQTVTIAQRLEIARLLQEVCRLGQNGMAVYDTGWNDARIAAVVNCNQASVMNMRRELVGIVKCGHKPTPPAPPAPAAVAEGGKPSKFLHERFSALEEEIRALREELNHLKSDLGVTY